MLRVLIVEDDDATAGALATLARELGHEVAVAHDGPVALVLARTFCPDVVLLDIGLPVMDGWDLAARLREGGRTPRFVAVTGWTSPEDRERSLAAGFEAHLVKPVDRETLGAILAQRATNSGDVSS